MSAADPELLKIYAGEQAEHVGRMRALLAALSGEETPGLEELLRRAHTLKGAARAVGLEETERIVHRMESAFARFQKESITPDSAKIGVLNGALDCIEDVLAWAMGERAKPDCEDHTRALERLIGRAETELETASNAPRPAQEIPSGPELIRVDASTIEALIGVSSQLVTTLSGPGNARQTEEFAGEIGEMAREYTRLRRACRPSLRIIQADPKFAALAECLEYIDGRLSALVSGSARLARERRQGEWRLRRQAEELHQYAAQARMTSAGSVLGSFGPMVRALADQEGKQVLYRAEGLASRADRLILQTLKDAVMHLLRNAVAHGIEPAEVRAGKGKPAAGTVVLRVLTRGDRLNVIVEDDGAGLDFAALRREAVRRGLAETRTEDLASVALTAGFTTASGVSTLAGRGMGLSIVHETVKKVRGEVRLTARWGGGTTATLTVPLSIATEHVLLVEEGGQVVGLPATVVEGVLRKRLADLVEVGGRECVVIGAEAAPLVRLSDLLGLGTGQAARAETGGSIAVAVIRSSEGRAAVAVERVIDDREVIVRETGLNGEHAGLSAGAIPLEDGTVAVHIDVGELVRRFLESGTSPQRFLNKAAVPARCRILVVDDSITTRSVERSILEAHGFEVELAVDGVEAMEKILTSSFDLVISDVAMPRMNGFELLAKVKGGKDTANLPVILVTSLESPEEQERGLSLGADAYIVKRKFDQRELIETVRQIL